MADPGDYMIVGKPFSGDWMVYGGSLDGWGPFGQEIRFSTREDVANSRYIEDARRGAKRENIAIDHAIYIACVQPDQKPGQIRGLVYHDDNEVVVDFTDDDLSPRQMRELGVL